MTKNRSTKQFIWGVSFFVALFVNFPIIFLNLPHLQESRIAQLDIFIQIIVCLLYSLLFIEVVYRHSKLHFSNKKLILVIILLTLGFIAVLTLLNILVIGLSPRMIPSVIMRAFLIGVIAYFLTRYFVNNERKNEILIENEYLKNENLKVQLASLKNQLNPHFLFNSLNTLGWLINDNKEKSQLYLQKLAQVLRYSLSMQEQSLVPLKEELALVESYIFLLQMRFGVNLKVVTNVENAKFQIPPLSLQLLIENAIKHNIVTTEAPLNIWIEANESDKTIKVSNTLSLKPNSEGPGIGLANLNKRFKILTNREIEIEQNASFIVKLPLIL